ncbi:hypothetical protein C8R46DRAFT_1298034 [Mycena filopes]|nr:hypothetical protein C8R46DRAFT_1298034 [Mycena filopes]
MPRAKKGEPSSSTSKPKVPRATKVNLPAKPPGIQQLKREWNASLPAPWAWHADFRHQTVLKGKIAAEYKPLTPRDIRVATLPYERCVSDKTGFIIHLYSAIQLSNLAARKRAKPMLPAPASAFTLPNWMEHMLHPNPPPLVIPVENYTCPPGAAKPDPDEITWTPSRLSGSVAVKDACRLYCITPEDIKDLSDVSKWIDLGTVARRAVTLHGGFYAHEAIVLRARDEEERMLAKEIPEAWKHKSRFRFSPLIHQQYAEPNDDAYLYGPGPPRKNPVAVHYPIFYFSDDDYGCAWEWYPSWGDF